MPVAAPEADTRFWALEALRAVAGTDGRLVFAGTVELPAGLHYEWQEEHVAAGLLDADWSAVAAALGALGHPVRLAVLRAVLGGRHTIGALGELPELASSGQVYHHLRELQAAGWVRQAGRNHYVVPASGSCRYLSPRPPRACAARPHRSAHDPPCPARRPRRRGGLRALRPVRGGPGAHRRAAARLDRAAPAQRGAGRAAAGERQGRARAIGRQRFPLASVRKVLVLGAYADAVAAGRADPAARVATADVDRWYWPGTDGGARSAAVKEWQALGLVRGETVPLDAVARAAIRWSDNAAADYLLVRLGRGAVERFARRHGLPHAHPMPFFGEFLAWTARAPTAWRDLSPARRARVAWRLAAATTPREAVMRKLPGVRALRRFVAAGSAGTPRAWARLMGRLAMGRGLAPRAAAVVRRQLEMAAGAPGQPRLCALRHQGRQPAGRGERGVLPAAARWGHARRHRLPR